MLSEVEIMALVAEAETQLSEYMRLAELASLAPQPSNLTAVSYRWDRPLGLTMDGNNNNGLLVSTPVET